MRPDEQVYRKALGINQSLLSAFDDGLKSIRDYFDPEVRKVVGKKPPLRMGFATDVMMLNPDELESDIVISPNFKEDDTAAKLFTEWFKRGNNLFLPSELEILSVEMELWKNVKDVAKRIAKIDTPFNRKVFIYLKNVNSNKVQITQDEFEVISKAVNALKTHKNSKVFFNSGNPDWEHKTQVSYYWEEPLPAAIPDTDGHLAKRGEFIVVDGMCVAVKVKILLDLVLVKHDELSIQPADLKSTSKSAADEFSDSFISYGYVRQGSLYRKGIQLWAKEHYPNYSVELFIFIVKSFNEAEEPLVFQMTSRDEQGGQYGGIVNSKKVRGWQELIVSYTKQMATGTLTINYWQVKEMEESGIISLDVFSSINNVPMITEEDELIAEIEFNEIEI